MKMVRKSDDFAFSDQSLSFENVLCAPEFISKLSSEPNKTTVNEPANSSGLLAQTFEKL